MINNRYEIVRQIDEGGISKVYLARDIETKGEVVVRTLKKEIISSRIEDIIRFRNEAAILSRLDHPNIVKLYETAEFEGQNYIVMEYIPGESLYKIIKSGKKFLEREIIEMTIQICSSLDYIHPMSIIHRDLKPGNIMVHTDMKGELHIKTIDFGLAFLKEYSSIKGIEDIAGTFCYMPPEQFGVISGGVDERSDLYSLGIILYQLLTGVLPFEGETPGSIIHRQIAMIPETPSYYNKSISETLDKIVLKLLEKEPDRRYQSAKGLLFDLEKYKKGERNFHPGIHDKHIKLTFKTGLISREEEFSAIKELYDKARKGEGSVCFISGEAGKGKTRLAEELRSHVYTEGGVFIDGKCFAGKSKTPYGPFKDALNIYLKIYQGYQEEKKQDIKNKLNEMTGDLCGLILQLNPSFSVIFNKRPELVRLEIDREKKRFLMVVGQFFLNLSSVDNKMVIFLDDLQWADEGSMDLLTEISGELSKYPLFIIGTYRNDEISSDHKLISYKEKAAINQYPYHEIYLEEFSRVVVKKLVISLLYAKVENIEEISDVIHKKSKGNPFFAIEILKQFVSENILYYKENSWVIDAGKLRGVEIASTIVDIVMKRISLLSDEETKVLSYAAVIGRRFDAGILFRLLDYEAPEIIRIVDRAIKLQLLEEDIQEKGKILFAHDRIKEAFYKKCGEGERKLLHRRIGKTMEEMNRGDKEKVIFDLAYHYIEGEEEEKILEYAYPAGIKAKENYAYEEAIRCLSFINRITEGKGEEGKELWINTNRNIIEIYLVIGKNDEAIEISGKILPFIADKLNKAEICKQISTAYFKKGDWRNCEEYGRKGLSLLGEKLPVENVAIIFRIINDS